MSGMYVALLGGWIKQEKSMSCSLACRLFAYVHVLHCGAL